MSRGTGRRRQKNPPKSPPKTTCYGFATPLNGLLKTGKSRPARLLKDFAIVFLCSPMASFLEPFFDSFKDLAPSIGHDFVLQQVLVPLARNAFDQKDSFLPGLEGASAAMLALRSATCMSAALAEQLQKVLERLDEKVRATPPFPTTSDHWALGVLRLCVGNAAGALMAFASAGKVVARGAGLCGKVEALFALRRFDDVVALVIAAETADGVLAPPVEEEKKRSSFAAKALQSVVGRLGAGGGGAAGGASGSGGGGSGGGGGGGGGVGGGSLSSRDSGASSGGGSVNNDDVLAWQMLIEEDNRVLADMVLLRRALSYHELHKSTGNDVYQFKCSQDFAVMFQTSQRPDTVTALLRASKAQIADNPETSCALFHQAAACNPRIWELPFLSSVARHRTDARAMIDIEAALRLDPEQKVLRMHRLMLMLEQRRVGEAIKELHSLVLADPTNAWLGLLRGRARLLVEDAEGAEADFRRVVATWEKLVESPELARGKGRLYCELAMLITALAGDPEKERLGLTGELLQKADTMLTLCIHSDQQRHHFAAFKLRSVLRAASRPEESASDCWEFVKCLAGKKQVDRSALDKEMLVCCKLFRQRKEHKEVARVATLALSVLGDEAEYRAHWKYHLASANLKLGDAEMALHLARDGLAAATGEKDKSRLEVLIVQSGGSFGGGRSSTSPPFSSPTPSASTEEGIEPTPAANSRPVNVPVLHLSNLHQMKGRTRRKTVSEVSAPLIGLAASSPASTGSPAKPRRGKSGGRSTSAIAKSMSDTSPPASVVAVLPPTPPPQPPPYSGELPSPPRLGADPVVVAFKKEAEPMTAREQELAAQVEQLTKELAEARALIATLKNGLLF